MPNRTGPLERSLTTVSSGHRHALSGLLSLVLLGAFPYATTALAARVFSGGDLELLHPSAPPTPPGAASAAGYLVVVNAGDEDDRLIGGRAPFAGGIELHRTTVENDVARMRRLDEGLVIPAGATVRLDPGGTHLMFTGLAEALPDGETRPATLVFERAGQIDVEFAIERPATSDEPADATDHGSMDHGPTDHGTTDHGTMDHGTMDHGTMDHDDGMPDGVTDHDGTPHDVK